VIRVPQDGNLFRHSVASRDDIPGPMDSGHLVQDLGERNSRLDFSADKVAVYEKRKFNAESLINVRPGKRLFGDQQKECQPGSLR